MTDREILARLRQVLEWYESHLLTPGELELAADFHISALQGLDARSVMGLRERLLKVQEADQWSGATGAADQPQLAAELTAFRAELDRLAALDTV